MQKCELKIGQVVQLRPDHERFPGMLVVVTEPKSWGCQGYLMSAIDFDAVKFKGVAYVRPKFEDIEHVGYLHWIREEISEDESED